jgi:signal peptidase I, bacterial type
MPGEKISYERGDIKISGPSGALTIDEQYLDPENNALDFFSPVALGEGQYFVLGDNRSKSFDSRNWGAVDRKDIIGIARLRVLPLNEFQIFNSSAYEK